ncbi:MAG: nitrogen regulation protein NR(II) [Alphaproteobacteria bacterium]
MGRGGMMRRLVSVRRRDDKGEDAIDPTGILSALPAPVIVVDAADDLRFLNPAGEQLLQGSLATLIGVNLQDIIPHDSPLLALLRKVRRHGYSMSEYNVRIATPRIGDHLVTINAAPLGELRDHVVLVMQELSIAGRIDRSLVHRDAARSVTAMAAMLAHEVKNPLSGVRGAAQLIEPSLSGEDRALAQLIIDEIDRICGLVDRMEVFSDGALPERAPVNIHEVLEHVNQLARNGFAKHVRLIERYDPSLPPVYGNRDQLIQVFLNLVKNAAEAVPEQDGEIVISTAFQHGVRLAIPGADSRVGLPLEVTIQDNGEGIPEDLRRHIFDPFVTTKRTGTGLGLALVAKLVGDHGGIVDVESRTRRTVFRVLLPVYRGGA